MTEKRLGDLILSRRTYDKVRNCQVVEYSRLDPVTGVDAKKFMWIRSLCPWDLREEDLVWKTIDREPMNDDALLAYAEFYPCLLPKEDLQQA